TGHLSRRIPSSEHLAVYTARDSHQARQLQACWYLGVPPLWITSPKQRQAWAASWGKLQHWAHMLGYGGHFSTKTRRYSTTLGALRAVRKAFQQGEKPPAPGEHIPADADPDGQDAAVTVSYTFAGVGWLTLGDAQLANTAAAKAREHRHTARQETETAIAERR
ncbi:MAG: replication initiator, partial [Sciscionella sp.]